MSITVTSERPGVWGSRGYRGGLGCGVRRIIEELSGILTDSRMSEPLGRAGILSFESQRKREGSLAQTCSQQRVGRIPGKECVTLLMWEE